MHQAEITLRPANEEDVRFLLELRPATMNPRLELVMAREV